MNFDDVLAGGVAALAPIVFAVLAVVDIVAVLVLTRYVRLAPGVRSLRERRNVALAIAVSVTTICFFATNSRVMHIPIDPTLQTVVLVAALSIPSIVNLLWLKRALFPPEAD